MCGDRHRRTFFAEFICIRQQIIDDDFALVAVEIHLFYILVGLKPQRDFAHGELFPEIVQNSSDPVIQSRRRHAQYVFLHFHLAHVQNHVDDVLHLARLFERALHLDLLLAGNPAAVEQLLQGTVYECQWCAKFVVDIDKRAYFLFVYFSLFFLQLVFHSPVVSMDESDQQQNAGSDTKGDKPDLFPPRGHHLEIEQNGFFAPTAVVLCTLCRNPVIAGRKGVKA